MRWSALALALTLPLLVAATRPTKGTGTTASQGRERVLGILPASVDSNVSFGNPAQFVLLSEEARELGARHLYFPRPITDLASASTATLMQYMTHPVAISISFFRTGGSGLSTSIPAACTTDWTSQACRDAATALIRPFVRTYLQSGDALLIGNEYQDFLDSSAKIAAHTALLLAIQEAVWDEVPGVYVGPVWSYDVTHEATIEAAWDSRFSFLCLNNYGEESDWTVDNPIDDGIAAVAATEAFALTLTNSWGMCETGWPGPMTSGGETAIGSSESEQLTWATALRTYARTSTARWITAFIGADGVLESDGSSDDDDGTGAASSKCWDAAIALGAPDPSATVIDSYICSLGLWEADGTHKDGWYAFWGEDVPAAPPPPPDPQCDDGLDNDGDTDIDFPADAGCADATDDDETDAIPSGITADLAATNIQGTTCVAPCAVHYDATGTTHDTLSRTFHSLNYVVECGIADAGGSPGTWAPTGNTTDLAYGAVGLCFYPVAGNYTMTLTVTAPDGSTDTDTAAVTVTAASSEFAAANEACCVANGATPVAGAAGCPAYASIMVNTSDISTGLGSCDIDNTGGAHRAVYLRGGDTFVSNGLVLYRGDTNPGLITSYGTGQATITNSSGFAFTAGHGWTLHNLAYVPSTDTITGFINRVSNTAINGVTLSSIDASGSLAGLVDANSGGAAGNKNARWAVVNTTYDKTATTAVGSTSVVTFGRFTQGHYVGNTWDMHHLSRNEFVTRSNGFDHGSITNNFMSGAGNSGTCSFSGGACSSATGYTCPLANACTGGGTCTASVCVGGTAPGASCDTCASNTRNPIQVRVDDSTSSDYWIVADNILVSSANNFIRTCVDDECGTGTEEVENGIIERNFMYVGSEEIPLSNPSQIVHLQGGDISVRNNIVDLTGQSVGNVGLVSHAGVSGAATNDDNIHVDNNTLYKGDSQTASVTYVNGAAGCAGCQARGNLFYIPFKTAGSETILGTSFTGSDNARDRLATGDLYTASACPFYGADGACDATCSLSDPPVTTGLEFRTCGTPITGGLTPVDTGFDFSTATDGGPLDDFGHDARTTEDKGAWD